MAGLGRGLSTLLSESKARQGRDQKAESQAQVIPPRQAPAALPQKDNLLVKLRIEDLRPSVYQPRTQFDNDSLAELAASIVEHGLLEPLLVKRTADGAYQIICGERRYRACRIAGIEEVPCLVREILDEQAYALALIENIQRQDLNPLEQAEAMQRMLDECGITQEKLAQTLGKSRSSITNCLRLNSLEARVKELLSEGSLSMGHAKVLLSLTGATQVKAAELIVKRALNVRQTELLVKSLKAPEPQDEPKPAPQPYQGQLTASLVEKMSKLLYGVRIKVKPQNEHKGSITLNYDTVSQLDAIVEIFRSRAADLDQAAGGAAPEHQNSAENGGQST